MIEHFPNPKAARAARESAADYERATLTMLRALPSTTLNVRVLRAAGLAVKSLGIDDVITFWPKVSGADLTLTVHRMRQLGTGLTVSAVEARQRQHAADVRYRRDLIASSRVRGVDAEERRDSGAEFLREVLDIFRTLVLPDGGIDKALQEFGEATGFGLVDNEFVVLGIDGHQIGAPYKIEELGAQYGAVRLASTISDNRLAFHKVRSEIIDLVAEASSAASEGDRQVRAARRLAPLPVLPTFIPDRRGHEDTADEIAGGRAAQQDSRERHHSRAISLHERRRRFPELFSDLPRVRAHAPADQVTIAKRTRRFPKHFEDGEHVQDPQLREGEFGIS